LWWRFIVATLQPSLKNHLPIALLAMQDNVSFRIAWLQRLVGAGGLLLIASTWRLWIPGSEFPQVPLVYAAGYAPAWLQWILVALLPTSLVAVSILPCGSAWSRRALLILVAAYAALVFVDQQRLQPWAYELAIMAVVLALAGPAQAAKLLRVLVISVYVYSGFAKLDYTFAHTLGTEFLEQLSRILHLPIDAFSESQTAGLALLFPLTELIIAGCLATRLRRIGLVISIGSHVALLLILGPVGLHHKSGVLLWNVFFIVQNLLLFGRTSTAHPATAVDHANKVGVSNRVATLTVVVAVLWPLLEPVGLCDHWLAWGLYAPRASRASLFIHDAATKSLPASLQSYLEPDNDADWRQFYIDRWSLGARGVPVYPQARAQLGIAESVIHRHGLQRAFQIIRFGPANRKTGEREHESLRTDADLRRAAGEYFFNSQPASR
jgi:hypothetical protein